MPDFLDTLAKGAKETIQSGYYQNLNLAPARKISLKNSILNCKANPIITEIKAASPSKGTIREKIEPNKIAKAMEKGGAVGISVLTEPKHFNGSLQSLAESRKSVKVPLLMKDIILSPTQLDVAVKTGADAVLLIAALFDRGYGEKNLDEMISLAHKSGLEVLLEAHTQKEFFDALKTDADMVGINNRNLGTLQVDLKVTRRILEKTKPNGKLVISESGISTPADVQFLRKCGAFAFLVGSAIMLTDDIELKVKELVNAK